MNTTFQPTAFEGNESGHTAASSSSVQSSALLGLGVALYALLVALAPGLMLAAALLGVLLTALAARAGLARHRRMQASVQHEIDATTGLHNRIGFDRHGAELLSQARTNEQPLGLVVFDFDDLLELHRIYGGETSHRAGCLLVARLKAIAGPRGLVARTGKAQFTVLLPGFARDRALGAVRRVLGSPARIEFDAGGDDLVLVPEFMVENAAAGSESISALQEQLGRDIASQRSSESRRLHYLQRERERHSRPMGLNPVPTMASPLGPR